MAGAKAPAVIIAAMVIPAVIANDVKRICQCHISFLLCGYGYFIKLNLNITNAAWSYPLKSFFCRGNRFLAGYSFFVGGNRFAHTRVAGMGGKLLPESLLTHGEEWSCSECALKRKTRTGGILQYPRLVRACALMRLNRRVPNGTHGGVRGRG